MGMCSPLLSSSHFYPFHAAVLLRVVVGSIGKYFVFSEKVDGLHSICAFCYIVGPCALA